MRVVILRLLGVLAIFAVSMSACSSAEEKKVWKSCLKIQNDKEKKSCIVRFEKRFYPDSLYNDEELNWSDIDWNSH